MDINAAILSELHAGTLRLPRLPEHVAKIQHVLRDEEAPLGQVACVLSADVALTARVIQVANSAWYWSDTPIKTLQGAVSRLGLMAISNVVVGFAVKDQFRSANPATRAWLEALWDDSLTVACHAAELAKTTRHLDKDVAFLGGLLRHVAKLPYIAWLDRHPGIPLAQVKEAVAFMGQEIIQAVLDSLHCPAELQAALGYGDGPYGDLLACAADLGCADDAQACAAFAGLDLEALMEKSVQTRAAMNEALA